MLALLPFTIEELKYRIISGCVLDDGGHDLKKRFTQSGRATLRNVPVLRFKRTGLARWRVHTGKGHQGLLTVKTAHVANLCHKLRPEDRANTKHPHHDRVLWKLSGQREHLMLDHGNRFYDCVELRYCKGNEAFDRIGHGKCIHL